MLTIADVSAEPLDLELTEPFGIAGGAQERAKNVLVRLRLSDGTVGLGEAAPFPAVSGETQELALAAVARARSELLGHAAEPWRSLAERTKEQIGEVPSALCAIECALIDALCRHQGRSLLAFFGGKQSTLVTDVTIPTGSAEQAEQAARRANAVGFRTLKVKVGGAALDLDRERIERICKCSAAALILDANASFEASQALELLAAIGANAERVRVFEQPTRAGDHAGLRLVRERGRVAVAADESARSAADVRALARERAVDLVNLKIMKSGVAGALEMLDTARQNDLGLMIGGMVESRLAMTVSACLAAGSGGFSEIDLDTPLFIEDDRLLGGFAQDGPHLDLSKLGAGHGVSVVAAEAQPRAKS